MPGPHMKSPGTNCSATPFGNIWRGTPLPILPPISIASARGWTNRRTSLLPPRPAAFSNESNGDFQWRARIHDNFKARERKVSGAWVFRGTRMPVQTAFENLDAGMSVDEITEVFDVTPEEVRAGLHFASESLTKAPTRG